mgnify:CR=1 FL=1
MQVEGTLERDAVSRALSGRLTALVACTEQHPSSEGGRLKGAFRIDREGLMHGLRVEAPELPEGFVGCVVQALQGTRFRRSEGTTHVSDLLIIFQRHTD